jgi:glycosyltransferase involved in cell wall biosynthesis
MKNTPPLVSVIVPCFKQSHLLDETLQSVTNQTFTEWECIIVNDGSPDNTEEVALKWCSRDDRFKYQHKINGGLPAARNTGVLISKGLYILPLDSDDILHPEYMGEMLKVLDTNLELGIASCHRFFFSGNTDNILQIHKTRGDNVDDLLFENQLMPSSMYRKECWTQVGGYDENMVKGYEDWEYWISITKLGWKYKIVEKPLFYYRKSTSSMLMTTNRDYFIDVKEYIILKHSDLYKLNFNRLVKVFTFSTKVHRQKELKLQNSLEYKIGKFLIKPFRILGIIKSKK